MKIKAKNKEAMLWLSEYNTMVSFTNGVAEVDNKVGRAMIELGYEANDVDLKPEIHEPQPKEVSEAEPKPEVVKETTSNLKFKS